MQAQVHADRFLAAHQRLAKRSEPAWLAERRAHALQRFAALGFPTKRIEEWKYTNVAPIAEVEWHPAEAAKIDEAGLTPFRLTAAAAELVVVDGHVNAALSRLGDAGLGLKPLAPSLNEAVVRESFGKLASPENHAFVALNTAFATDGAFLHVPREARIEAPIHLLHVTSGARPDRMASPRNLVVLEPLSQATLVESFVALGDARAFANVVTEAFLGEGAALDHTKVQLESPRGGHHVACTRFAQARNSRLATRAVQVGGSLVRNEVHVLFTGEGADLVMDGLFMGRGSQHVDNHTTIDHAQPACTSREFYKGLMDDKARGVFYGHVWVRPGAQKTDSKQTNRNLLLSDESFVDSVPALDIRADDVKCSHASAVGQLDEDAVFYLRSRGIGEAEARTLLTHAFAADALQGVPRALKERLDRLVLDWIARRAA